MTARPNGSRPPIDIVEDLRLALDPVLLMRKAGLDPDGWQREALRSETNTLLLCSRQSGKSTTTAAKAVHRAVYRPGSLVLAVSPSQRQSGELYEKIGATYKAIGAPVPIEGESAVRLKLTNGSRILSLPGSEATVRGFSAPDLILVDEAARVADELYTAIRPMLAVSKGTLFAMTTPFGRRGFFYEAWRSDEPWRRIRVPASDCPRISAEFLAGEREAMDSWTFRQEYGCEFADNSEAAFGADLIESAVNPSIIPLFEREESRR